MCKYVHGLVISEETNASQFVNSIQDLLRVTRLHEYIAQLGST